MQRYGRGRNLLRRLSLEELFFRGEVLDHEVYTRLEGMEKDKKLKKLLKELAAKEQKHTAIWGKLIGEERAKPVPPKFAELKAFAFILVRKIFGITFMIKLLERNEAAGLKAYRNALDGTVLSEEDKKYTRRIIEDEMGHELALQREVQMHSRNLSYMQSIVFGLNDGLVEVLAAISGLAAFSTSVNFVIIGGIIIAISGTLSMTGGAYLAAKSQNIVEEGVNKNKEHSQLSSEPTRNAYYTGVYYFLGALVPVLPFIMRYTGFFGIGLAILFTAAALTMASIVIAVIGNTSIKNRVLEMLAISLGASAVTIIIGTLARVYLGVTV